ncbi:hypothetical protein [Magnetospirillum aberrantis]|uniref:Uncharacterized protein n=1 Tax=Magnetospirillum aberrantis SpK TaxID=908842 RepID=A0A7C9QWD2_9PROT|nr:hypothetical protein [Magnetospirillum aberrantis]NFV82122.1 hypothetical protein [Magnetospirillum aberrantis SpK]
MNDENPVLDEPTETSDAKRAMLALVQSLARQQARRDHDSHGGESGHD